MEQTPRDEVLVRNVAPGDLEAIIHIDAATAGRRRDKFLELKLAQAFRDKGIAISFAAEVDARVVGFLLARVYYGEFGTVEPSAVMDVVGVNPDFQGRHVASALIDQLRTNLLALGIRRLQTEVPWDNTGLIGFFQRQGFTLAQRVSLDLDLERTRR